MIAVLIVLQDSSDENLNGGAAMLRRVKEAAVAALREAGLASAAASTLFGEGVLIRCAHWEPAWASARSKAGAPPPPDGYTGERSSLWSLLAWHRSYHGPSDPVSGRAAHHAIAQALAELAEAAPTAPLVVVAQGLGCLVAEAHFACLVEQRALPPTVRWPDALLASDHATPLERGATLHSFWALGSPIAMWLDTLKVRGEPAGDSRGGHGSGDDTEDTFSQRPSTRAPRYHERLERARKANSSTPDGASHILTRHLSEDAPSPAPAAGNTMEQHKKEALPRTIREQGLMSVPSPQMSSSMPVAVLQLGGRHHFWHRHDPLCSIPITQEYGLGSAAKDVEVRLGGSCAPPAPSDYLKAVDYEKRCGRTKKEVVVPLGRHLASILLGLRSQETEFDRIVERRPTSAAEQQAMADMLKYSSLVGKPAPSA